MACRIGGILLVFCAWIISKQWIAVEAASCDAPPQYICVNNCTGKPDGDYQNCDSCNQYVSCVGGVVFYNRTCPGNLVWDDNTKNCEWTSSTCGVSVANPNIMRLGYPQSVTPGNDTSTVTGMLFLPNRNVTFPADGKLLNISLYASAPSGAVVKLACASVAGSVGGSSYKVNSVSAQYAVPSAGWNNIFFNADGGYLAVNKGGAVSMIFDVTCSTPFWQSGLTSNVCTNAGTYQAGYVTYLSIAPGDIMTNTVTTDFCRAYNYIAFYIPNDVCENVCLGAIGDSQIITQQLNPLLSDKYCWKVTAPNNTVIKVNVTVQQLGGRASVLCMDGNGTAVETVYTPTTYPFGAIYSYSDSMWINFTSPIDTSASTIKFSAIVEIIAPSSVPPGYYGSITDPPATVPPPEGGGIPLWAIILMILLLLLLILLLLLLLLTQRKKARVVPLPGEKEPLPDDSPPPYEWEPYVIVSPPPRSAWLDPSIERKDDTYLGIQALPMDDPPGYAASPPPQSESDC